ncbi:MAG: coenzyme F420-0:L-glutamate ligase [Candidatus Promineifilaceae bacterium]
MQLSLLALPNIPEVMPGDDVGQLICEALISAEITPTPHDIIAIAQKIISKAENRYAYLDEVEPSEHAQQLATETNKDPRLVQLIVDEMDEVSRKRQGVLVVRHRLGFVSANAGIDRSNVQQNARGERVLLLPVDPDGSAEKIRQTIHARFGVDLGIIITDSHGRPHRSGTIGVAIGVAGMPAILDKRGTEDRYGFVLKHTDIGVADEIAAASGLLMGQAAESTPIILIRGLTLPAANGRASDIYRPKQFDLYR